MTNQTITHTPVGTVELKGRNARPPGPEDEVWYKVGEALLTDGLKVGRDFCSYMIGASTGAIPIYLALLKIVLPDTHVFSPGETAAVLVPPALFMLAALQFFAGYFPKTVSFSYFILSTIRPQYYTLIERRYRRAYLGMVIFFIGLAAAVGIIAMMFL